MEYDYDDVLILPKPSSVNSREDVNVKFDFLGRKRFPIFSAPMKNISTLQMVKLLDSYSCIGILNKFDTETNRLNAVDILAKDTEIFGVACGLEEINFAIEATKRGASFICLDIANGYISRLQDTIKTLRDSEVDNVMAGNVVTYQGAYYLGSAGAKYIRVGIGSGKVCTTRNVTGIGRPQLSAVADCAWIHEDFPDTIVISDGGISNSGNAVKSFSYNADAVMLGSILAKASELNLSSYLGMASKELQREFYGYSRSVEGISIPVVEHLPLAEILSEFIYGIKSACTYLNCDSYEKINKNSITVEVSRSAIKEL
jgi:GMP reductase